MADVFVFFKPVTGTYFSFDADDAVVKAVKGKDVVLKQPHCAFIPHALSLFPKYRDSKYKLMDTGEKFIVTDTSPISHNTKVGDWNEAVPSMDKKTPPLPNPGYRLVPLRLRNSQVDERQSADPGTSLRCDHRQERRIRDPERSRGQGQRGNLALLTAKQRARRLSSRPAKRRRRISTSRSSNSRIRPAKVILGSGPRLQPWPAAVCAGCRPGRLRW